mgnify:CR=1 FL=1
MTVDSVITLENDVNCLLLEKVNYENDNYFLAVVLTIDEEPSNNYVIFKEIIEDNENYVEKVEDVSLLRTLLGLFTVNVDELIKCLPDEIYKVTFVTFFLYHLLTVEHDLCYNMYCIKYDNNSYTKSEEVIYGKEKSKTI